MLEIEQIQDYGMQQLKMNLNVLKLAFNEVLQFAKKSIKCQHYQLTIYDCVLSDLSYKIKTLQTLETASKEYDKINTLQGKKAFLQKRQWHHHLFASPTICQQAAR